MKGDVFDQAIDKALLKLSQEYGISLPKDDYVLIQLFLNREILATTLTQEIDRLAAENDRSKAFFRETLVLLTKQHKDKIKSYELMIRISLGLVLIAFSGSLILLCLYLVAR